MKTAVADGNTRHNMLFGEDGYLSYDSAKPMYQANTQLKAMGYKVGDMLWKPGTKDNLNGRELTGRIASISESGLYMPEYVNDAANSSHKGTGFAGWKGEVGLGADQAAYNAQMSDADQGATDPRTGEAMKYEGVQTPSVEQFQVQQQQKSQEMEQNNMPYDFSQFMPSQRQGQKFQSYQDYSGPTSFGGGMKFNFDPSKFMQGQ